MKQIFTLILICITSLTYAQKDTLVFKNKDIIVGEFKELKNNIITVKTSYSDADFKIEFDKVVSLQLENNYTIELINGTRLYGALKTNKYGQLIMHGVDNKDQLVELTEIVSMQKIHNRFFKRFKANFDLGFNLSRSNDTRQLTFAGGVTYLSDHWNHKFQYNLLHTYQENADNIDRIDWQFDSKNFLHNRWFIGASINFLSNSSQGLESRFTPGVGTGKYLFKNTKLYLLTGVGFVYNLEKYLDSSLNKKSTEGLITVQFNMFNFKNINFNTSINAYPSLSEKGRFRTDFNSYLKYDLPFDIYIKTGLQLNYDNQPAVSGFDTDYVFTTGIGWELK